MYKSSVAKDLRKLSVDNRRAIVNAVLSLAVNPLPTGVTKLQGSDGLYRVRHGDYRIIYQIQDKQLIVLIIKIGHRKDVYR